MAKRSANIVARVEPEVKAQAEAVLGEIGLSMSDAVNLFCKQIILRNGMPFSLKSEIPPEVDATTWSEEKLVAELEKSYKEYENGEYVLASDFFNEVINEYGL